MKIREALKLIFAKKTEPKIPEVATSIDEEPENADWLHREQKEKGEKSDKSN